MHFSSNDEIGRVTHVQLKPEVRLLLQVHRVQMVELLGTKPATLLIAQLVKNLPAIQETLVPFLGREDPLEGIDYLLQFSWVSLVAQLVKNPPAMWETWV